MTRLPFETDGFHPHPLTAGGHRQTLLGYWCRRRLAWGLPTEDMIVDGGGVRLLLRASWQAGPREDRPALVLVHGLGSSDAASYCLATGHHAFRLGWHVVRMNLRGAGDSVTLCPGLYNAGLDGDILDAVRAVARTTPQVAVLGFSLGGSLALLAAGRQASRLGPSVMGVVAVCPAPDLAAGADAFARPENLLYRRHIMRGLSDGYRRRQLLQPDLYEAGRERGARTIREYDERITAPYGGYRDADDYYARSSAGPHLASIAHPTLMLAAADDPLIPVASVTSWPLPPSRCVQMQITPTGGHVGFVAHTAAPGRFWAAERALAFLGSVAGGLRPGAIALS